MKNCLIGNNKKVFVFGIAMLLALALIMLTLTGPVLATNDDSIKRLYGANRWETSANVALAAYPGGSENVIIARGDDAGGWADGLAGGYLAGVLDAPILLTAPNTLPAAVADAIGDLGAQKAYILGGTGAVSAGVEAQLSDLGLETERISGATREATAAKIALMGDVADNTAFIVQGRAPADSMVAGAAAFAKNYPILLVSKDDVPAVTLTAIANLGIENIIIVGGTGVVSSDVQAELAGLVGAENISRLSGANREATSVAFAKNQFADSIDFSIVNGRRGLADAVGASVFGNPILYVNSIPEVVREYLDEVVVVETMFYIFGGTGVVSSTVAAELEDLIPSVTSELLLENLNLVLHPDGSLTVDYDLAGTATTAAVTWYVDDEPFMVYYLPMEGGAANALGDYSGNNITSTVGDTPTWNATAGYDGHGAFTFDGNDVIKAVGDPFPTNSSYSKSAWIYKTANDPWQNIICGDAYNHLLLVNDGQIKIGHNALISFEDPDPILNNQWYFVVSTFDYDTGELKLYKDVAYVGGVDIPAEDRDMDDPTLWVGRHGDAASWRGRIDDARVFDFVLTPAQITQMYSDGAGDSNTITTEHTIDGQTWRAEVIPFSSTEAGTAYESNEVVIEGSPPVVEVENVVISSDTGQNLTSEDILCSYDLSSGATTAATAWYKNGDPTMALYLPMEGGEENALKDYSGNDITAVASGDVSWSADAGYDGRGAFVFGGSGDLNAGANFPVNSSYTKTAWVYRTGSGEKGGNNIISGDANDGGHALWAPDTYDNKLSAGHNGTWNSVQDSEALDLNTWYFVALTYDASTQQMVLYKNGTEVDSATVTAPVTVDTIFIGSFGTSNEFMWQGTIDDPRVYKHALSAEQIAALYASGSGDNDTIASSETASGQTWQAAVTPFSSDTVGLTKLSNQVTIENGGEPLIENLNLVLHPDGSVTVDYDLAGTATTAAVTWYVDNEPLMVYYLPMEGGAANALGDYSGNNITSTVGDSPTWSATAGHDDNGAFIFDGNDVIEAGGGPFPTNSSYSKSAWIYKTANDPWQNIICGDEYNHLLSVNNGYIKIGHNALISFEDPDPILNNQWYFVVSTFDYNTGELKLYKDGAYVGEATIPEGQRAMNDPTLWVGRHGDAASWRGTIDDPRVFDYVLTPAQIAQMYNGGTGDSNTITTGHTVDGQTWRAEVIPFSSTKAGNVYNSKAVVIGEDTSLISVMPLGDSITDGAEDSTDNTGYRRELYLQLDSAGYNVDFVGTMSSGDPSDFDRDHEGRSGWRTYQIRDNIYSWLVINHADIVLLHIGTNDISGNNEDVQEVEDILNEIGRYESDHYKNVTVLVARIILRDDSKSAQTVTFNDAVKAMVDGRILAGDKIIMVDQENALVYPTDLADNVHPNDSGYSKMATTWFNSLNLLLTDMLAGLTYDLSSGNSFITEDIILGYMLDGDVITAIVN